MGEYYVDDLYAIKAKKEELDGNVPKVTTKVDASNSSYEKSVSDFLKEIKDYYGNTLSEDVNNHFGRKRGKSDIEGLLKQDRNIPKTYKGALAQNERYRAAIENLKEQFKITKGHKVGRSGIARLTAKVE